jgi:hypothetical protein
MNAVPHAEQGLWSRRASALASLPAMAHSRRGTIDSLCH